MPEETKNKNDGRVRFEDVEEFANSVREKVQAVRDGDMTPEQFVDECINRLGEMKRAGEGGRERIEDQLGIGRENTLKLPAEPAGADQ